MRSQTGTKSLQLALEMLGYNVYDQTTVFSTPGHLDHLINVSIGKDGHYSLYPISKGNPDREAAFDAWNEVR